MFFIQTINLTHFFSKKEKVLDAINLNVPEGSIYGFLGPNGAGKTTTLKLILSLLKKQEGEIEVFGERIDKNRTKSLKDLGSLIEMPSIYAHLTAYENLKIYQKLYKCPVSRIDEVLELVGLAETKKKRTGKFSLGMKQRLGIAIALLHQPKLLILDEPTNGLDPNGMIEIRELLLKLNREEGITIIISSHLLAEIERLVTHVGVINKGKILFEGTLDGLHKLEETSNRITFTTNKIEEAHLISVNLGYTAEICEGKLVLPIISDELIASLNMELVRRDINVYGISTEKKDLETIFMDLIK